MCFRRRKKARPFKLQNQLGTETIFIYFAMKLDIDLLAGISLVGKATASANTNDLNRYAPACAVIKSVMVCALYIR